MKQSEHLQAIYVELLDSQEPVITLEGKRSEKFVETAIVCQEVLPLGELYFQIIDCDETFIPAGGLSSFNLPDEVIKRFLFERK